MLVSEYINFLVNSEAYQLASRDVGDMSSVVGLTPAQISNQKKFIGYINLANLEIHKRFQLIKRILELDSLVHDDETTLPNDFMIPLSATFADGEEIPLNNEKPVYEGKVDVAVSLLFPEPYLLRVKGTDTQKRKAGYLTYIASPKLVSAVTTDLKVPHVYTDALLNYAAYKAHVSVSGKLDGDNNTYYTRYEIACKKVLDDGLQTIDNLDTNTKLHDRGFV